LTIVATAATAVIRKPRWAYLPWHDDHPDRLDLNRQLPCAHLARQIEAAVDRLDLSELYERYHGTGSEPYDPKVLLGAVLYEVRTGSHSPAQWFKHAWQALPLRWLLRGYRPSRSCWYALRDRIAPLLFTLNAQPLTLAVVEDLTPATRAAADGTSVAANASRHRLLNEANLTKRLQQLDLAIAADQPAPAEENPAAVVATPLAALVAGAAVPAAVLPTLAAAVVVAIVVVASVTGADVATVAAPAALPVAVTPTVAAPAAVPGWMAKQPASRMAQRQRFHKARQHLSQRLARNRAKVRSKQTAPARVVISTADPEAALGLDKEKVFRPLYNVQLVDDLDSPFILGYEVFAQPNDAGLLDTMLQRVRALTGRPLGTLLTDMGYVGGADLRAASTAGVTVYAPLPKENSKSKQLPKSAFTFVPQEQTYRCPQGHTLKLESEGKRRRSGPEHVVVQRFRCPPVHCLACPLQAQCAKQPASGRTVSRSEYEPEVEALRQRMESAEAKVLYKLRKQTVELVNADWKEHRKLRRFSGRGLARASCQVGLMVLAHNLLTLLTEEKKKVATDAAVNLMDIAA
jgi:transposase